MARKQRLPVLVVGAGPTGMTAALDLSRRGIPVRLVDKEAEFSNTSRALAVQARTLELFAQRGLTGEMVQIGNRGERVSIYADGKLLGQLDLAQIPSEYNEILLIAQSETERLLREQLDRQGCTIERQTELVAMAQTEDTAETEGFVTAVLRRPDGTLEEAKVAYLIAAQGAHSTVRHTLGLAFKGKSLPHTYALADLHVEGELPEHDLTIFVADHGLLAIFPLGNRRFRMIATQQGAERATDPDLREMQQLYDAAAHIPARLREMVWSSRFRINSRMVSRLRVGRIFLGGDAAHVHSPAGGQGMNTGIQDMINLSWKLAMVYEGQAKPELLDTYEAERIPVIEAVVSRTESATDMADANSRWMHLLVTHVAPWLLGSENVRQAGVRLVSQVGANYRKSPLSEEGTGSAVVTAGDRVPSVRVIVAGTADTQPTELQRLLDPDRFTWVLLRPDARIFEGLLPSDQVKVVEVVPARESHAGDVEEVFGKADAMLVRPDGYLAWIGSQRDRRPLEQWAKRWFASSEHDQAGDHTAYQEAGDAARRAP